LSFFFFSTHGCGPLLALLLCEVCLVLLDTTLDLEGLRPEYSGRFRCIGPACEDSCCTGWSVYFDRESCGKYERLPDGPLKVLIAAHVTPVPADVPGSLPARFAKVQLTKENACPFLDAEKLCRIQAEHGEAYLSTTCATYPRMVNRVEGLEEKALALSCPEAARLVLLSPDLQGVGREGQHRSWRDSAEMISLSRDETLPGPVAMRDYFWPIREFVLELLTNRGYALWQRLFLLGVFTRRLGGLARGELDRGFLRLLREFDAAVDWGVLRGAMEAIPADLNVQLDLVLRLAGLRLARTHIGQRFLDTVEEFKRGIGNGPGSTMESLIACYGEAHDRWYEPFMRAHPHVMENLLVNAVFRSLFPFGAKAGELNAAPDMEREFALLVAYFALMKGLLIGVAGCYREEFGAEHVVRTVQSASKHFEHHPGFLDEAHALLVAIGLDNARGLTMLMRN
jgi:lysine-N-methylase